MPKYRSLIQSNHFLKPIALTATTQIQPKQISTSESPTRSIANGTDALHWQDILDQLNSGEMPPKKKAQPGKEELAKVVGDLTESLQSAQAMLRDSGGDCSMPIEQA